MKTRRCLVFLPVLLAAVAVALASAPAPEQCTTAVVSSLASVDGRPILWKNRDTGNLSNKVIYIKASPYSYIAVVDASNTSGKVAWDGINSAGFAIENSASFNLGKINRQRGPGGSMRMRGQNPGQVMAAALRTCATVDDFDAFLRKNESPTFGVHANYGVIDAEGGAAYFEVGPQGFKRYNAAASPLHYLLRTNFSMSGTRDQGAGYIRFDTETALFKTVPAGKLSFEFILQTAARDLVNPLSQHPLVTPTLMAKLSAGDPYWIASNNDTINRRMSASDAVFHGVSKGMNPEYATMWVILGEPVTSIAVPVWVAAGQTPPELWKGKTAPMEVQALRLKAILRPLKGGDKPKYMDVAKLENQGGTGWLPGNLKTEREIFAATNRFLARHPDAAELASFERQMAAKALARLQSDQ